jgi:hypothetical protein
VLTFLTLIAPIQLNGNFITLFWALESVLLLWLSRKSGIKIMELVSFIIILLMVVSLILDWQQNYIIQNDAMDLKVILNKAFLTSLVSMASVFAILQLFKKSVAFEIKGVLLVVKPLYVKILFAVLVYCGLFLELNYQLIRFELENSHRLILLGIFNYLFVLALIAIQHIKPSNLLQQVIAGLSVLVIISYMSGYLMQVSIARDLYLYSQENTGNGFYIHYVLLFLFFLITVNLYRYINSEFGFKSKNGTIALWVLAFIAIYINSAEFGHISVIYQKSHGLSDSVIYKNAVKHAYPIVWAITSLLLMISGMKFRLKALRLASLVVFAITILKLFIYDLQGNATGKIISFILLGVILLLISFLYQKLKFIIQDDEKKD